VESNILSGLFIKKIMIQGHTRFRQLIFVGLLTAFCFGSLAGTSDDEVLLTVHDRKITQGEFLYHFYQNYQEMNQNNIQEYLELFIDYHLKLAMAREKQFNHQIGFINELAEYRLLLAAPYLTDQEKIKELAEEAMERLKFKVRTNHILVKFPEDANPDDTLEAYSLAVQILKEVQEARSFQEVAQSSPQNHMISVNQGNTSYITAFQSEYAYESAVFHMKPGEISLPVKSTSGYYIVQLIDKKNSENFTTDHDVITIIKEINDERRDIIKDAFVTRLKKEWDFRENKELLEAYTELVDDRIYKGTWMPPADERFQEYIFFIDGRGVSLHAFSEYMQNLDNSESRKPVRDFILHHYEQFVSERLIQYENYKLPEKYPEFRYQYEEYRDAMLLLQITKQQVWLKASSDSAGLKKFFIENRMNYAAGTEDVTLQEVYDIVQADYQEFIMTQWVRDLRSLYRFEWNEKVLSSILQKGNLN
jgi:parvulin-like peptidyl-prolyl isomerase